MTKAEYILDKHIMSLLYKKEILEAMKEIAEDAFEAGEQYSLSFEGMSEDSNPPNKKEYIEDAFTKQLDNNTQP